MLENRMRRAHRTPAFSLVSCILLSTAGLDAQSPDRSHEAGIPVQSDLVVSNCSECHEQDASGRLSRISYMRKSPEGWQTSIRRMVMLNDVQLDPDVARQILRYLSNEHGLAPEELRPGHFEVERRTIEHRYEADVDTETTCKQCHSLGRVITQRRTEEEWGLLLATHRGLYPDVDFQAFRRSGPPAEDEDDTRHPMDKAIAHLSSAFPLETPEWSAWSASMRTSRLDGTWAVTGHHPGRGPVFGVVNIRAAGDEGDFTTQSTLYYPLDDDTAQRTGRSTVYTGYQWRGRSAESGDREQLREVMFIERDWRSMWGRWYTGANDETGLDMKLQRIGSDPVVAGVYPRALRIGDNRVRVTIFGANLAETTAGDIDLGPGITIVRVAEAEPHAVSLEVNVSGTAIRGARDVFVRGGSLAAGVAVYEQVDRIAVTPAAGMARIGGTNFPKQFQQFEAIGFDDGPDDDSDADDLQLGLVPVTWSLAEYSATYEDDDVGFVGEIDDSGLFTPALDGPNPQRRGNRNNIGDVWVVATHARSDGSSIRARAHLLVTVPLYIRWDPWGQSP
jgi:quinohemoprotein amine dehydrogenase